MSAWASLQFCTTDNNGLWQLEINRDIIQEFWRINLWNCPRSHSVPSRALYGIKYFNCRDLFWSEEFVGGIGVMLLNKFRRLCSLDILIWNHDLWSKKEDISRSTSVLSRVFCCGSFGITSVLQLGQCTICFLLSRLFGSHQLSKCVTWKIHFYAA